MPNSNGISSTSYTRKLFLLDNGIESLQVFHCVKGGEIMAVYEIYANSYSTK